MDDDPHKCVVLFYKYFVSQALSSSSDIEEIKIFLYESCTKLRMKGRVLLAKEGINGTLSATNRRCMDIFIEQMESYIVQSKRSNVFRQIDWKFSGVDDSLAEQNRQPFPDLKISITKEIVSTGNVIQVEDIKTYGGKHLTPQEFHQILKEEETPDAHGDQKELVVIDVRNTFEHAIGHFQYGATKKAAINPKMVTFSSFDGQFCAENAEYLKDKKVIMYCTGGIRCEKASVMLRKRGVEDVSQLSGGIHRYLEKYEDGFFRGKNFVFDQRVALAPKTGCKKTQDENLNIVGKCIECQNPYDEISGSRVCTVCRDLVLICPQCVSKIREYHCERHQELKKYYFTFLETFDRNELQQQVKGLTDIRNSLEHKKNARRTLLKQINRVRDRIEGLHLGKFHVDKAAPRKCRTCRSSYEICDGLCWGFWKHAPKRDLTIKDKLSIKIAALIGDKVVPGPDWNEVRFGKKENFEVGTIVDVKSWCSGGEPDDCVSVEWEQKECDLNRQRIRQVNIYRFGSIDKSGVRRYDLKKLMI